jgi:effector-binding domain-containing protein
MSYAIEIEKLPAQNALVIRTRLASSAVAREVARLLPEVFQYALDSQAGVDGMPFTRYLTWGGDELEIEAGMPVSRAVEGNGRIRLVKLPGGPAVVATHLGPYTDLPATHEGVKLWLRENGKSAADSVWEEYVTDPGDEPDPDKWETRICQPIL